MHVVVYAVCVCLIVCVVSGITRIVYLKKSSTRALLLYTGCAQEKSNIGLPVNCTFDCSICPIATCSIRAA